VVTKEGVEQLEMGRERGINARTITQGVKFIPTKGDSDWEGVCSAIAGPKG
jgi:hypothetical protein